MDFITAGGVVLMGLGVLMLLVAVGRTVTNVWTFGVHEIWALPLLGGALLMAGRWLA